MDDDRNFLEELLDEAEKREKSLHASHIDLVLSELSKLEVDIEKNFTQAEAEKKIIDDWTLKRNSKIQDKIDWMTKKLEMFMKEQGEEVKTIDLPNGKLLIRKQPDKIQIENMEEFMLNANSSMLTVLPETVRPDLRKVMTQYKRSLVPPVGTKLVIGEDKFSIKLRNNKEAENGTPQAGAGIESAQNYKTAV